MELLRDTGSEVCEGVDTLIGGEVATCGPVRGAPARRTTGGTGTVREVLPEPTLRSLVVPHGLDPAGLLVVLALGVAHLLGVRRLAGRGRSWPRGRSAAFGAGMVTVAVATQSGVAAYEAVLFSAHSTQHVLLGMVAPALLALGAPVTLALQAADRPLQLLLLRVLHSAPARSLAHPAVGWVVFGGTLVALYAGPLLELSMRDDAVHVAVHLHLLLAGTLFCWTAVGLDPSPHRIHDGARVGFVFLAVPVHAIVGLVLVTTTSLLAGGAYAEDPPPWLADVLADQRLGAGILWGAGEVFGLVLTGIALARWMATDQREARRADARAGAPTVSRSRTGESVGPG